jgi:hypothetical protein
MEFKQLLEEILNEGQGRKRAKTISHAHENKSLDVDQIKKEGKPWKSQGIERTYFKEGPLKGAFYTKEENPAGEHKYNFSNGSIVIPKGSDITKSDIEKHSTKYHKSSSSTSSKRDKLKGKGYKTDDDREIDDFITTKDGQHVPITDKTTSRTRKKQWYKK